MFGRASLLLILGFSTLFMVYTANMLTASTNTVDVYVAYYSSAVAEKIAQSGANLACASFFQSSGWSAGYSNISFQGGTINVSISYLTGNIVQMTCTGAYNGYSKTIEIKLQPSNFAKFGNFYNNLSALPATGDTLDGPIHFNDYCTTFGSPVFLGKVTCLNGLQKTGSPANPKFLGGFESGVQVPLTLNSTTMTGSATGGVTLAGTTAKPYVDVDMTFNADATVTYKTRIGTSVANATSAAWSAATTAAVSTFAPNGVILIKQGNVTMRGTVDGKVTVAALANGAGTTVGNVFLDNSIVYKVDPRVDPTSNDMLGIVAENKTEVTFNNSRGDINIMASIFNQNSGLSIANYSSYTSISNMKIFGGITGNDILPTAVYSGTTPTKGYRFVHKYDTRFMNSIPPFFPMTGTYEVISWLE